MVNALLCLAFVLAINKSASQTLTVTHSCIEDGQSVTLRCKTTNFANTILFFLGLSNQGGCTGGSCGTFIVGYSTPTQSGTYTEMKIDAYNSSRDGGVWKCDDGGTKSNSITLELGNCGVLCKGKVLAYLVLIIFNTVPEITEIILILIRLYCLCCCTQKVNVNVQTRMKLLAATYDINNKRLNRQMEQRKEDDKFHYSCFVYGEQTLTCRFESESSQLTISFMISDDLLCADVDQNVILPTIWDVNVHSLEENPIKWFLNDVPLDITQNGLYNAEGFLRISFQVRRETSGIYKFVMPAAELNGCVITVSNMRVSGRQRCPPCTEPCLYLAICIPVNLVFWLISVIIVVLCRSNDGFCVENHEIVLAVLIPKVVLNAVLIILICKLRKKTGKGHSSGHGNGNQTEPETGFFNPKPGELVEIKGKNQPLRPL